MKNKFIAILILLGLMIGNVIDARAWTRNEAEITERNTVDPGWGE